MTLYLFQINQSCLLWRCQSYLRYYNIIVRRKIQAHESRGILQSYGNVINSELAGADMVELDVRTTKDGQLVLMHNETVNETTTGVGAVSSLTLEQIKSFDMVRDGKVYKDEHNNVAKVPTLLEALKATKDKIYVNLDLAGKNNVPAKVLEVIHEAGVEDQVMLFASGDIAEYQKLNPLVAVLRIWRQ